MNHRLLLAATLLLGTALLIDAPTSATGVSTMHGDVESSVTTEHAGPAPDRCRWTSALRPPLVRLCSPTPLAQCGRCAQRSWGRTPEELLLDPAAGDTLARLNIPKGSLLGGVYAYLDERDRLVLVGGDNQLVKLVKGA